MSHEGAGFEAEKWREVSRTYRPVMGLALGRKILRAEVDARKMRGNGNAARGQLWSIRDLFDQWFRPQF
jgi:hypothetical protein